MLAAGKLLMATDGALSFAYIGSTSATGAGTTTPHGSAADGDLAVMFEYSVNGSYSYALPTGWSEAGGTSNIGQDTTYSAGLIYRVLTTGVLSTAITLIGNGSFQGETLMAIFRPSQPINSVAVASGGFTQGGWTSAEPTDSTVEMTAGDSGKTLVGLGFAAARTNVAPPGGSQDTSFDNSPVFDGTVQGANTNPVITMGYKFAPPGSSPSDIAISMADAGWVNGLTGLVLEVD